MKLRLPAFCITLALSFEAAGTASAQANPAQAPPAQLAPAQVAPGHEHGQSLLSVKNKPTPIALIKDWFNKYDNVRRQAQMNPAERANADAMLAKGLAIVMPGPDKLQSQELFQNLESKNSQAAEELKGLPLYPETDKLHRGYYQYFQDTSSLFADYLQVQNNIMAPDPSTGKPLMGQLLLRKKALEDLDVANKELDAGLRNKFKIAPYRYQ